MLTVGVLWVTWLLASSSKSSALDVLIFVVGLFAVLVTRALTTLSEARRLAVAGVHHSGAGTTAAGGTNGACLLTCPSQRRVRRR